MEMVQGTNPRFSSPNASVPSQAKGPVLARTHDSPDMSAIAHAKLAGATQRGNTGGALLSERTTMPTANTCAIADGVVITIVRNPRSSRACRESGVCSGLEVAAHDAIGDT